MLPLGIILIKSIWKSSSDKTIIFYISKVTKRLNACSINIDVVTAFKFEALERTKICKFKLVCAKMKENID